ncbi:MAG: sulfite exporter TauE/SafE family protein [Gammaproteobacteria bacterium]|nr:sulfite exporter TauE/SafE family protein [Gammaproteobacteria bacterium]
MDTTVLLGFLLLVILGCLIQTLSGFAIALVITGGMTSLGLVPITFTVNVVSIVSLANVVTALHGKLAEVDGIMFRYAGAGIVAMSGGGLLVLNYLSQNSVRILELFLGVVILVSAAVFVRPPRLNKKKSSNTMHFLAGGMGGFLSGMFGAGGPPIVLHVYRQPLPLIELRSTLLAIVGVMTSTRLGMEALAQHVSWDMLRTGLICIPVSMLATMLGRRLRPCISDRVVRNFSAILLCIIGGNLFIRAWFA